MAACAAMPRGVCRRADAARVGAHHLCVDLRVVLAAVAEQHKVEVGVGVRIRAICADLWSWWLEVMKRSVSMPMSPQQQRPGGDVVDLHEVDQQVVQVPRAAGNVEDGVAGAAGLPCV